MAYLLSQYPAVSHTFILDEITGLRQMGFTIETASINNAATERPLTPEETVEANSTYYVKKQGPLRALTIAARTLFTRPLVFFRGVIAALTGVGVDPYRILFAAFYFIEALIVVEWMRERDLHHLHVHFGGSVSNIARIAGLAAKVPYSITFHGPGEFFDQEQFLVRRKAEDAAFTLCISDFGRGSVMRMIAPKHWPRIHTARLGVDTSLFVARTPRSIAVPVQILCVGRLVQVKGQRVLLEAAGLLAARGHNLHISFIGEGPDAADLAACVSTLGLDDSIYFLGPLTHAQICTRLAEADVFVLPSFAEGIPVALMEAMATQLACVSTWSSGIPELITHDTDGLLVQPGAVVDLADALESLLTSPQLRARLGIAARQRVMRAYEQRTNLEHTAELLRKHIAPLPEQAAK
ncbi:MAG TPA: glycosyltransferase family 4 protein [Acidobacteriaceae bacterium]|nr:glycosyltransferase family 4 protein [Acidobacteriaceae bacterium]